MKAYLAIACILFAALLATPRASAQTDRKVTFTGAARGVFFADHLRQENDVADTTTAPRLNSGHVLADLGIRILPNKNTEILGMVRIRNDYGGFWGSGVTFDVRQLMVKGVVGGIFRYQLGDINYRMTRYTLWNYDQEVVSYNAAIFRQQTELVNYDQFYFDDHSWRQQGAAGEFALVFKKWVKELQVHMMTSRVAASNFSSDHDRLFSGLQAHLVQSKYLELGVHYASMYDVAGTARSRVNFRNPVITGTWKATYAADQWLIESTGEVGRSSMFYQGLLDVPRLEGKIADGGVLWKMKDKGWYASARFKRIESTFRSPGAQTKRIDFARIPDAYTRITNQQILRPIGMLDLMRESDMYTLQLRPQLMQFSPVLDNITPFGDATPNRQGWSASIGFEKKKHPVKAEMTLHQLSEVTGEGTLLLRRFSRQQARAEINAHEWWKDRKKLLRFTLNYRRDATTRGAEELVRGVDLTTEQLSVGMEVEVFKDCDLLLGHQFLRYNGFEFQAVRNEFTQIFNFTEFSASGRETMQAAGVRYRFNDQNFLSMNLSQYVNRSDGGLVPNYRILQFMMLYSMKF